MGNIRNKKKTLLETVKKTITFNVDVNIYKLTYQKYSTSSKGVKGWVNYSSYSLSTDKYETETFDKNIDLKNELISYHQGFRYNQVLDTYFKKIIL